MSAGFGIGLTRHFCPLGSLAERVAILRAVAAEASVPLLRDFVPASDLKDWSEVMDRGQYELLQVTRSGTDSNWQWCPAEEVVKLNAAIGDNWSDSGSFEDCFLICDEETSLILPTVEGPEKAILRTSLPDAEETVVYAQTQTTLERLRGLMDDPECDLSETTLATLKQAEHLLEVCLDHSLPFYLAWS